MTFDADLARGAAGHRRPAGRGDGTTGRREAVVRAGLTVGAALLAVPVTVYVYLGLTLDLHSCLDRPDQAACGTSSPDLVGGLCLAAWAVLSIGGTGLAVVSRAEGRWWWPALGGVVTAYVVLLGLAISAVVP